MQARERACVEKELGLQCWEAEVREAERRLGEVAGALEGDRDRLAVLLAAEQAAGARAEAALAAERKLWVAAQVATPPGRAAAGRAHRPDFPAGVGR